MQKIEEKMNTRDCNHSQLSWLGKQTHTLKDISYTNSEHHLHSVCFKPSNTILASEFVEDVTRKDWNSWIDQSLNRPLRLGTEGTAKL